MRVILQTMEVLAPNEFLGSQGSLWEQWKEEDTEEASELGWSVWQEPQEPHSETFTEPETQREPKRKLPWWKITVGFWMFPASRRRRLVFMRRLLPRWSDSRASFLLQVTDNIN